MEEVGNRIYKVTFTPQSRGKHRVYVYLNGMEVKGSPFSLRDELYKNRSSGKTDSH